jgi:hypothetical protein
MVTISRGCRACSIRSGSVVFRSRSNDRLLASSLLGT